MGLCLEEVPRYRRRSHHQIQVGRSWASYPSTIGLGLGFYEGQNLEVRISSDPPATLRPWAPSSPSQKDYPTSCHRLAPSKQERWMSRLRAHQTQKLGTNQPSHDMSPTQPLPHHNLQIHPHPLFSRQYPRHSPHTLPTTDLSGKSYQNHLKLQPPIHQYSAYLGRYPR